MLSRSLSTVKQCSRGVTFSARAQGLSSGPKASPVLEIKLGDNVHNDEILLMPFNHIKLNSGKKTRAKMIHGYNHWLQIPQDKVDEIEYLTGISHEYNNLTDDLEDDTQIRRGIPVAHVVFGKPNTLNSANYAIFLAILRCMKLGHPQAAQVYVEHLTYLHRGQGMETYWRDSYIIPSEEDWKKMTIQKNSGVIMAPFHLMQLFSDNKQNYDRLFSIFSLYVQLKDDYTDLISEDPKEYKAYCEDVSEGKYAFPILHALHQKGGEKVFALLRQRPRDEQIKKYFMTLLVEQGSLEYGLNSLRSLDAVLREEIKRLGGNPLLEALLDEYAYLMVETPKVAKKK